MKRTVILFVVIAISIVMSVSGEAAEKRLALVIGNADYKTAPLKNTTNDANDMEKTLKSMNFEVIARVNAGLKDMEDAIREFGAKLRKHDVGLFYYSGHGIQHNGVNFLIPTDAEIDKETDLKYRAVQADMVLDEMYAAKKHMNIVIMDACRNNPFPKSFRSPIKGLARMNAPSGMLIAYATSPDSVASDESGRNGTYTANLLKYIMVPNLPIEKMLKEVRKGVLRDFGNKQHPWESVSITDDFYFVGDNSSIATEKLQQPIKPDEKPKQATLNITVDVSGAEVWIDGKKKSALLKDFTIDRSGNYDIEITAPGYKKYRISKNIELGKEYEVVVLLEKKEAEYAPVYMSPVQQQSASSVKYQLRSEPVTSDDPENAFNLKRDEDGWLRSSEYIHNNFSNNRNGTITDHTTNLIWQKSGSYNRMGYEETNAYIEKLKSEKFAGYGDWRLPTVDELKSLLTKEKQFNNLYITPIFDKNQLCCWSSDKRASGGAWHVNFGNGFVLWFDDDSNYVRAVRSLTP